MNHLPTKQMGFSLIELMISLALGLVIAGGVIQIMVSSSVTEKLNRAVASAQENGRFIISRMRSEILMAGRYDILSPNLNQDIDVTAEAAFIQNHPVPVPGDFSSNATLGSIQGASGGNDTLVVSLQAERDCRGYKLGYDDGEEFFVVNQYFLDGTKLKCRGFDGRVLQGLKVAVGNNGDAAFTLLDDVESFQVLYGVTSSIATGDNTARPVSFVTADEISGYVADNGQVVAIRIALLVKGDGEVFIDPLPRFKLLNEQPIRPSENRLYKKFETTITLRNVKNFMRSRKI
jgi:type IV pilus assembly protein PilW